MQPLRHFPPGSQELPAHHRAQQHHQRRQNLPGERGAGSTSGGWEKLAREADELVSTPSAQDLLSLKEPLRNLE